MRNAALKASAAVELKTEVVGEDLSLTARRAG